MAFYGVQGYSYDALGRLESAVYGENEGLATNPNRYNETVLEYTENGAIKRFQRRGLKQDNVYGKIDNLHISLDGNRVVHVDDDALPVARKGSVDFTDSGERQTEYTYNSDGALTGDANRGIAKIDYDACGYPRRVQFMDGSVTEYVYTVTGVKLRTVHRTAVPGISVAFGQTRELTEGETLSADSTDYLGNLILEDGEPSKYLFEGGYCSFDGDGISYHYYDRDHQGNIRAVVNSDGTVEQIMNYYPFGTPFSDGTALNPDYQPYKYNGKEFESMHGRNAYDYGARFYDPLLPTWDRMDPLCEKYYHVSPYAYCLNNPVRFYDKDGCAPGDFFPTVEEAAIDFGLFYNDNSIREKREYGSYIIKVRNMNGEWGYTYTVPVTGTKEEVKIKIIYWGYLIEADVHTHGASTYHDKDEYWDNEFSGMRVGVNGILSPQSRLKVKDNNDIGIANYFSRDSYLTTPNGSLKKYDHKSGKISTISEDMPSDPIDPTRVNSVPSHKENNVLDDTKMLNILRKFMYNEF